MLIWLESAALIFTVLVIVYFVLYNFAQMLFAVVSVVWLVRHRRRRLRRARQLVHHLSDPPGISLVVAAYNEERTIVESLRALLALDYPKREIVVVNDGSSDGTLALLKKTFHLVPAPVGYVEHIPTAPVRGLYRSVDEPDLVLIDKENGGGKADASNAGINAASMPGVMALDADTILEPDDRDHGEQQLCQVVQDEIDDHEDRQGQDGGLEPRQHVAASSHSIWRASVPARSLRAEASSSRVRPSVPIARKARAASAQTGQLSVRCAARRSAAAGAVA